VAEEYSAGHVTVGD